MGEWSLTTLMIHANSGGHFEFVHELYNLLCCLVLCLFTCARDYFIRVSLWTQFIFALYTFCCFLYVVNISSPSCISYKYRHTYIRMYVCMNVRWLNCLQRIRLVTHYENISGLSVQLLKTGQQVAFNLLRTLRSPLSAVPKPLKLLLSLGKDW